MAAAGAAIVVNYASDREGEEKVVADIAGAGGRAVAVEGNVARSADVDRIFAQAKSTFGTVGILVNSAGTYRFGTIEEVTEEEFHRHFDTNVLGLLLATKAAVAQFGFASNLCSPRSVRLTASWRDPYSAECSHQSSVTRATTIAGVQRSAFPSNRRANR